METLSETEVIIQRSIFISLGFLLTLSILVGCGKNELPKNQTPEGTCSQTFLDGYNKIVSTQIVATAISGAKSSSDLSQDCIDFLKIYGKTTENCSAVDLKSGDSVDLNVKEVRSSCDSKIPGKVYSQ